MKKLKFILFALSLSFLSPLVAQDNWEILFDGKSLNNFEQLNGNAKYEIKDGNLSEYRG